VTIESCPTSNVTLAGLSTYGEHPLWEWGDADKPINVSISSDDPLHFGNNVLRELGALIATGKDLGCIRNAVRRGLKECSGGVTSGSERKKQLEGARGYRRIVDAVTEQ
jgi:hypothetical protein